MSARQVSRRRFLRMGALAATSLIAAACAPTPVPTPKPEPTKAAVQPTAAPKPTDAPKPTAVPPTAVLAKPTAAPANIEWWSHWANEPAKVRAIEKIAADYAAANPNVKVKMTWWDKNPLVDAVQAAMTAGKGAPDITTFDTSSVQWVQAGWCADLEPVLPWANFIPEAKGDGAYAGIKGIYKFNIGFSLWMYLYNPEIFSKVGISVPDKFQFTDAEFIDVVKKVRAAGYAGLAQAGGNRPAAARFTLDCAVLNMVGLDDFGLYMRGEKGWDNKECRQVLKWYDDIAKAKVWPDNYSTMTIDEYHVYFHTQRKAAMLCVPTWYTGRSFKPVAEGGQDPNFKLGMLRYPAMAGGKANDMLRGGFESGYAVLTQGKQQDVAKDILKFAAQPKYGAIWVTETNSPSCIKHDMAKDGPAGTGPNPYQWYWDEFNKVYGGVNIGITNEGHCAEYEDAMKVALNDGIPLGLMTVDEAVKKLDANLCKK